ncbi:MAG: 2-oxoglutarate dehydrogenase E1 component [Gammaproteobacteria bacterium]|nr:MAG: 2-oxoglutarate dehydrogenase E1 component [Gammaproteobacteria bacterium]
MGNSESSCLYSGNAGYIEELYEHFLTDPDSLPEQWRDYFNRLQGQEVTNETPHSPVREAFRQAALAKIHQAAAPGPAASDHGKQVAVINLIEAYRVRGHRQAELDPLKQHERPHVPELDLAYHHLHAADLDSSFNTGTLHAEAEISLREIVDILKATYCRTIGAEFMHITETDEKRWIQERLERSLGNPEFSAARRTRILHALIAANLLEEHLHHKYVGQKRFSLEGGDSLIPLLDELINAAREHGVQEVVMGMAHRGRLNVLVNIMGKLPRELFDEFEGRGNESTSQGDVKYHLGYSSDIQTEHGAIHLTLAFNPSHLEIIDPVVEGSVRARQDRRQDRQREQVIPVLIHGDAAFAGQGVIMETFNLSQTRGYTTGGTVHIIINNQIGFTTSDPLDSRSSLYCTDVAKMVQAPIFHVNGDDPEAVVFVTRLALDFRFCFKKDVVIDMICYRKHGHSEADEPGATQPTMYRKIRMHTGVREGYADLLRQQQIVTAAQIDAMTAAYLARLEGNQPVVELSRTPGDARFQINFAPYKGKVWTEPATTAIDAATIRRLTERITALPAHFTLHPSVQKIIASRKLMGKGDLAMDWGFAETLAYASLLEEGHPIRLSGQDSGRGTFFHRHAVIHNQTDGDTYLPLQHLHEGQAPFLVVNSTLSEEAVLAFEYGYSSAEPKALVIWEAQFGDFANGAQVVFDQFISSCEAKWGRYCGLTVFLPHGFDGQGPEHSSARLERFLQLCAGENMQICFPSTPAQMFHLLRRQVLRPYRKPLIVMSPKSLLRHKLSVSPVDSLKHRFLTVIDEIDPIPKPEVTRLLICSGKVYFDLLEARRLKKLANVAIARLEQLYPFPSADLKAVIDSYANLREVIWVQEEPKNQGGWYFMQSRGTMLGCLSERHAFGYAGRFYSASPATGHIKLHLEQQKTLVNEALLNRIEISGKAPITRYAI